MNGDDLAQVVRGFAFDVQCNCVKICDRICEEFADGIKNGVAISNPFLSCPTLTPYQISFKLDEFEMATDSVYLPDRPTQNNQ